MLAVPLESFLVVADTRSVSRAAEKLNLTQPAVTKQIRALEESFGVALVERAGRGVRLTEAGELVAEYGRRGARVFDECRQALAELGTGVRGTLALGAGVTTSIFRLPAWLELFRQEHPHVEIVVRTGTSRQVAQQVVDREVELGLVTSQVHHAHLESRVLFSEEVVLVVSPAFVAARKASLDQIPLILLPATTGFRLYLNDVLGSERLASQVKMETDSVEAIKSFVAVGLGGSFLPATSVEGEFAAGTLKRLRLPHLPRLRRQTAVVRRRDRRMGIAAQHFLRVIGAPASGWTTGSRASAIRSP